MSFDGNGTYVRNYNWTQDAANAVPITASRFDTEHDGFAAALTNCVTRDGQGKPTADISWQNHGITSLRDPTAPQEPVTLAFLNGTSGLNYLQGTQIKYAQTAAEIAAGVTPVNYFYPPYTVDRYATNTVPSTTDMWQAIFNADKAANLASAPVVFLAGSTYAVDCTSHASALTQSATWTCNGVATIQRKDFTASTAYFTVIQSSKTGLVLENLIFDGQVTKASSSSPNVDLGATGSYSDTTDESLWRKVYGVRIYNATGAIVQNCVFKNFLRAGLRIDGDGLSGGSTTVSKDIKLVNCNTKRTRGSSGDGFYFGGVTDLKVINCHVYDYQRIAFVEEFAFVDGATGCRDTEYVNCTADLGHDGVSPESNAGFWSECGDNGSWANCTVKNGGIGFIFNAGTESDTGTTRPYIASFKLTNCAALRCQLPLSCSFGGGRSIHASVANFTGEADKSITYAFNSQPVRAGVLLRVAELSNGPSFRVDLKNIAIYALNQSTGIATNGFGCFRVVQGVVTDPENLIVNLDGLQTRWSLTNGNDDTGAITDYRNVTNGYFGDVVFGGQNDIAPASRFRGHAFLSKITNHTHGYAMVSMECFSASSNIHIEKTRFVMRAASLTNNGLLNIESCPLVDFRGDLGWTTIRIANSLIADSDGGTTDRTSQSCPFMHLIGNKMTRQVHINMNGGDATHRYLRLQASGNKWEVPFNTESGVKFTLVNGTYAHAHFDGNIFKNTATGAMGATKSMIEVNADNTTTVQLSGAGNSFDSAMVTAGGHVCKVNTAPTYNDAPQTVAAPFLSVFGVLAVWEPI